VLGRPRFGAPLAFGSAWTNLTAAPDVVLAAGRNVPNSATAYVEAEIRPLNMSNKAAERAIFVRSARGVKLGTHRSDVNE
jgi:hypothetical protein